MTILNFCDVCEGIDDDVDADLDGLTYFEHDGDTDVCIPDENNSECMP